MNKQISMKKQQGAALVVGLILMLVITVLAISGMNTATTELAMARNDQNYENAFQAAETGLAAALGLGSFPIAGSTVTPTITSYEVVSAQITYEDSTPVPDKAFSMGSGSSVLAHHYVATAQAASLRDPGNVTDRDSTAVHTQAFYVVGPGSSTLGL